MENKYVMKMNTPTFFNCLKEVLSSTHKKTEAEVISAIGTVLTNSKDWDQHRTRRTKNNTSHHEEDIANEEAA
ncbi:unnamed protein product [Lasius platythorax]|uniref:Uncharacterized protein n=1 Tax=Lasius platythorax TaxID=488582 RepID=A0AAV2NQ58_9HYME